MYRRLVWLVILLLFCSTLQQCDALIKVVHGGNEYLSRPDKYVGLQMKARTEYSARLQRVPGEAHLCGGKPFNVTVPEDGRPVALLVKKGVCTYAQKAEFASRHIHPLGVVKFLIIDGETRLMDQDNYKGNTLPEPTEEIGVSPPRILSSSYEFYNASESWATLRRRHANDITVVLLRVSYQTGAELLDLVMNEDLTVKKRGGTLVTVDATAPPLNHAIIMIWSAICVVLSLVGCCCLANALEDMYESREPEPEPPRRHRRRRLTLDQVRSKFPIGIFDGSQLIYEQQQQQEESAMDYPLAATKAPNLYLQPSSLDDACTICLDEYVVGDKLRCLPCGHAFHYNCIAKWLVERSATCPLCNLDLYEEEEESDDEEDEDVDPAQPDETAPAISTTEDPTRAAMAAETLSREPWWRNIFRRRTEEHSSEGLTEPLLPEPEEAEHEAATSRSDEETPEISNAVAHSTHDEEMADGSSSN